MKTVLGLSVTAAGVGWVLVDGTVAGGRAVDDDEFTVHDPAELVTRCLAAVRGAEAIAVSSGQRISSLGVCWSGDVEDRVQTLLAELRAAGFADVRSVRQVVPTARGGSEGANADRPERAAPCALLAELLAETEDPADADDMAEFAAHEVSAGPEAGQVPAYHAAQAVVTNAAPPQPVKIERARRTFTPPKPALPSWTPALSGVRISTVVAAAAVTAVIALVAVGSQFAGSGVRQPGEAALAGRSSEPIAATTEVVPSAPPAVQPMAAMPPPAPVVEEAVTSGPPVQRAVPRTQPVAQPAAAAPPSVEAAPPAASQVSETAPEAPAIAPDPVAPVAAPLPADQSAPGVAPEVLPPAPVPPPPFWMLPPFVPPPPPPPPAPAPPAPEAFAAPVEHLPPPAPVDPVLGALP